MKKVLITGANGMLAKAVRERFKEDELILTDVAGEFDSLDITDKNAVMEYAKEKNPDIIINCAAYTAVDKAEEAGEIVEKINAEGPGNLAKAANEIGATLVHISTDYVFGGALDLDKSYKEDDEKHPVTAYGITKLKGEELIKENTDKFYIFRTAWLYGDGKNFVRTMLNLGNTKDEISVVNDQHGSPTYAVDLANYIYEAINKNIPFGIYNATNDGFTTWYDFTLKIFEDAGITTCKVNPVSSEEYVTPAKRPLNSMMSKEKLKSAGIEVPTWEDALERYLKIELK